MELVGKVWKDGKFWIVEVPAIDVCTQGRTKKDALMMIQEAILELMAEYFPINDIKNIKLEVFNIEKNAIGIKASNNSLIVSFSLIRQREQSQSTVREVAGRLGFSSPNAYAQYERGNMCIGLDQYERLLQAANPTRPLSLRVV